MTQFISPKIWDAIERASAEFGGVAPGGVADFDGDREIPRCVLGMAWYSGAIDTHCAMARGDGLAPFGDQRFFGRTIRGLREGETFPLIYGGGTFDVAMLDVQRRLGLRFSHRVPWALVAAELDLARGPDADDTVSPEIEAAITSLIESTIEVAA